MDLPFCFVFDTVQIFYDDFEWIFFVIFSRFLVFEEVLCLGFCFVCRPSI